MVAKTCSQGTKKWIGNPPTVNHKAWKSREDGILGWSVYL